MRTEFNITIEKTDDQFVANVSKNGETVQILECAFADAHQNSPEEAAAWILEQITDYLFHRSCPEYKPNTSF